jgi:hypothetical protein
MSNQPPHDPYQAPQGGQPGGQQPPQGQPGGYPPPPQGQPGGYPQQGGYGAAPQMSGGGMAAPVDVSKPKSIELAVKLMYVGAGMAVLGILSAFLLKGTVEDSVREGLGDSATQSEVDAAITAGMIFAIVIGLISVGLWILMAKMNEAGKSWARIVATVLGALSILLTLLSFAQATSPVQLILNIIGVLLAGAILFFLWKPESTAYYQAKSGQVR